MAHVFISYSTQHRALTERVAALLRDREIVAPDGSRENLTVWWDTDLLSGDVFHREITRQIDAARVVVVIWTEEAVESDWVYAEAQRGASQRKLVPLRDPLLAFSKIPLPYSAMHIDDADKDAAIVASVMARLGGSPSEDVAALGDTYRWLLDPKAELPLPRTARISPALLLQAKYSVVPFFDLDDRRSKLIDWALGRGTGTSQIPAGRVIHGPGGLGKTRLMIEVIRDLADQGWLAGFVNRDTLGHATRGPQLEHLVRTGHDARGLLLVLDYAEGRADDVITLARLLIERERAGGAPARLVLLARGAGDWWRDLSQRDPNVALVFGSGEEAMDTMRLADVTPGEPRLNLWRASAAALKPHLVDAGYAEVGARDPAAPADAALAARLAALQQHPDFARPLAIQMEALLWLRGASPEAGQRGIAPMLERMVALERAHWEKVTEGVSKEALDRAVAQVTAVQGVEGRERAIALLLSDNAHFGSRSRHETAKVVGELSKLYGEELSIGASAAARERLSPLEPDLIGEHHVATIADADLIDSCLSWIQSEPAETQQKRRRDLLTVLQRATQPEHGAIAMVQASGLLDGLIPSRLSSLAADMIAVMIETPGALGRILDQRIDRLDDDALAALDDELPMQSLALMELSLRVAERRVAFARNLRGTAQTTTNQIRSETDQETLNQLAIRVGTLGVRFSDLGRHEEALVATREAADIYRRLAQSRSEAVLPNLAGRLTVLSVMLANLGHHDEALPAAQEAVDIYRRLAQSRPDIFLPDLAGSLINLGMMFSNLARHGEAMIPTQEAVEIYRRLAQSRPGAFLSEFAGSMNNLGMMLYHLGRHEEALTATQEAVDIRRRLAQSRPDAFLSDLTASLNNLGNALSNLDRHEEAVIPIQEAVDIKRSLAQARPDAFLRDLAMSLTNLGSALSKVDRHEEALAASQEAVDLTRRLAQSRPEPSALDLAMSLGAFGNTLVAAGRDEEAAAAFSEGLVTIAPYVERHAQAFSDLTLMLAHDYIAACEAGRIERNNAVLERILRALGEPNDR